MASRRKTLGGHRTLVTAKKSNPAPLKHTPTSSGVTEKSGNIEKCYNRYLVFVDDPNRKSPFALLEATDISDLKRKEDLDKSYLNNACRKRNYDVAFTTVFDFPCRIFAKVEPTYSPVKLARNISDLNTQFRNMLVCNVDVEKAYETLLESHGRKVKAGICYNTGKIYNKRLLTKYVDTSTSFSEPDSGQLNGEEANKASESNVESDNTSSSDSSFLCNSQDDAQEKEEEEDDDVSTIDDNIHYMRLVFRMSIFVSDRHSYSREARRTATSK